MYLSIGHVARMTGVSRSSLRRWDSEKTLTSDYRTPGGHRRYSYKKILEFLGLGNDVKKKKQVMIYARVSASKQRDDLKRQISCLEDYAMDKSWEVTRVYSDIASGLNDGRKNLLRLISDLPKVQPDYILCTYRDRVARFGTGILQEFCKIFDCKLIEIMVKEVSSEEELMHNFIAVLTSFIGKFYRARSGMTQVS